MSWIEEKIGGWVVLGGMFWEGFGCLFYIFLVESRGGRFSGYILVVVRSALGINLFASFDLRI